MLSQERDSARRAFLNNNPKLGHISGDGLLLA